jgi:hypothetical protein
MGAIPKLKQMQFLDDQLGKDEILEAIEKWFSQQSPLRKSNMATNFNSLNSANMRDFPMSVKILKTKPYCFMSY